MKITKTTILDFDETAELERINHAFAGPRRSAVREWLLSIHTAFVTGDLNAACERLRHRPNYRDQNLLEFVNETVFDVLSGHCKAGANTTFTVSATGAEACT